jgi:hypothetical protein
MAQSDGPAGRYRGRSWGKNRAWASETSLLTQSGHQAGHFVALHSSVSKATSFHRGESPRHAGNL